MNRKKYYNLNEVVVVAITIIILRNIYIHMNLDIRIIMERFSDFLYEHSDIFSYVEIFYVMLLVCYNIILLFSKKIKNKIEYRLKKYFILSNLLILFFYVFKEPLFFYSNRKLFSVLVFLFIEILFIFFVHKIRFKIRSWQKVIDEIFRIALISAFVYYLQYFTALVVYVFGLSLFFL